MSELRVLREYRERLGWSQGRLAAVCRSIKPGCQGISARAIGFWEAGSRTPSAEQLAVLLEALQVPPTARLDLLHCIAHPASSSGVSPAV